MHAPQRLDLPVRQRGVEQLRVLRLHGGGGAVQRSEALVRAVQGPLGDPDPEWPEADCNANCTGGGKGRLYNTHIYC